MLHLERLAVHLREAERLTNSTNVSELRIALILLDSAAELQMYRQAESELSYNRIDRDLVAMLERSISEGATLSDKDQEMLQESRRRSISNNRRKKIDREFSEKATFLSERDLLTVAEVRVLNKLHDYRNATYHRDTLRAETVKSAVHIYLWLNCQMLLRFKPLAIELLAPPWPATLAPFFANKPEVRMTTGLNEVATTILDRSGLLADTAPSSFLSSHALDRIQSLADDIEECAENINGLMGTDAWDFDTFLTDVQLHNSDRAYPTTKAELSAVQVPITRATFAQWENRATELAKESDPIACFSKFADLEDEMESIEDSVQDMVLRLDMEIQNRIDFARGK